MPLRTEDVTRLPLDIIVETRGNLWKVERDTGNVYLWTSMSDLGMGNSMGWQSSGISCGEHRAATEAAIEKYTAILRN